MTDLISKKIRGFRDILPSESKKFLHLENLINKTAPLFNINQIRLPVLESINLFKRSIGETSDIVTKEIYAFEDRNKETVCMIPEGTASCVRLALENNLIFDRGIKKNRFYYYSPMFRHERPQKGRYRQFSQFGVEFFGEESFTEDIDLLLLSKNIFENLNLKDIDLFINSIGTSNDRNKYSDILQTYFKGYSKNVTEQQLNILIKNPMRLLDSKDSTLTDIIADAPLINDYLNKDSQLKIDNIMNTLTNLGIKYTKDTKLVRGLDYYNDLVFEWKTKRLGTQDAICAGGRYDDLSNIIGGRNIPAVGLAMGMDRIVELMNIESNEFTIGLSVMTNSQKDLINLSNIVRKANHEFRFIQMDLSKSLSKQIKIAIKASCDLLIIVGNDEISNNTLTIKYLKEEIDDKSILINDLSELLNGYK